jgi:hypothetical protein
MTHRWPIRLVTSAFACAVLLFGSAWADGSTNNLDTAIPWHKAAPTDPKQLKRATTLAQWVTEVLRKHHATVAVIARPSERKTQRFNPTRMSHVGFAVWSPDSTHSYHDVATYNLLSDHVPDNTHASIEKASLLDFFIETPSTTQDALVLIPNPELQVQLQTLLTNGQAKALMFTNQFSMLSPPTGTTSINCDKWTALNLIAARTGQTDATALLRAIPDWIPLDVIRFNWLERWLVPRKAHTVRWAEIPNRHEIPIITPYSLYLSPFFDVRQFYNPATQKRFPDQPGP